MRVLAAIASAKVIIAIVYKQHLVVLCGVSLVARHCFGKSHLTHL
jgi:hypothetical protein